MSDLPKLTQAAIQSLFSEQTFGRGQDYYTNGAVLEAARRGSTLLAEVEGSSYAPYRVTVELDAGGVVDANCTCPYDWGGYCKHIAAVLLTYIHKPDEFVEQRSVESLLAGLDSTTLADLLKNLLARHPHLIDWVEGQLSAHRERARPPSEKGAAPRRRQAPLDPTPFRRQVNRVLHSLDSLGPSEAYWGVSGIAEQLEQIVEQAQPFVEAGDGRNALVILDVVASAYVEQWIEFDDSDGYLGGFFSDLGSAFAEAILSSDLSAQERQAWAAKLTAWQAEVDDYGIDDGFDVAIAAAQLWWDDERVQQVLAGSGSHLFDEQDLWYADRLIKAYLNVLMWQERTDEYLNFSRSVGRHAQYATMLVALDRSQDAADYALQNFTTQDDALYLAKSLRDKKELPLALTIAEHGLGLTGQTAFLACWLRDLAVAVNRDTLALRAARQAFMASHHLDDYKAVESLAGADWPQIKPELLQRLGEANSASTKIDIYLYEGMIEQAVQTIDQNQYAGYNAVEKVVDAAYKSHPDWTIRQCKQQAEPIMDRAKSKYYHHALRWLEKARRAYLAANRAGEWQQYVSKLIEKHRRQYSLRPGLEALQKKVEQ